MYPETCRSLSRLVLGAAAMLVPLHFASAAPILIGSNGAFTSYAATLATADISRNGSHNSRSIRDNFPFDRNFGSAWDIPLYWVQAIDNAPGCGSYASSHSQTYGFVSAPYEGDEADWTIYSRLDARVDTGSHPNCVYGPEVAEATAAAEGQIVFQVDAMTPIAFDFTGGSRCSISLDRISPNSLENLFQFDSGQECSPWVVTSFVATLQPGDVYRLLWQTSVRTEYVLNETVPGIFNASLRFLTPVPLPATVWLLGSALGVMGWMRRKNAS